MQLDVALVEKTHVGAKGCGGDVSDLDVADIGGQTLDRKGSFKPSVETRERDRIVLGKAGKIFNNDILASHS